MRQKYSTDKHKNTRTETGVDAELTVTSCCRDVVLIVEPDRY